MGRGGLTAANGSVPRATTARVGAHATQVEKTAIHQHRRMAVRPSGGSKVPSF